MTHLISQSWKRWALPCRAATTNLFKRWGFTSISRRNSVRSSFRWTWRSSTIKTHFIECVYYSLNRLFSSFVFRGPLCWRGRLWGKFIRALHIDSTIIWCVFPCSKWWWWTQTRHHFVWAFLWFWRRSSSFLILKAWATRIHIIFGNIFSSTKGWQLFVFFRIFSRIFSRPIAFSAHNIILISIHTDVSLSWGFAFYFIRRFLTLPQFHTSILLFRQFLAPLLINFLNILAGDSKPCLILEAILLDGHCSSILTNIHGTHNLNFNQS